MAETNAIKFDPQKILEASNKLAQQHRRFTQCAASIKKKADSLSDSWKSDSADIFLDKTMQLDTQSTEVAETLLELSQKLASASGIYKDGEAKAEKKVEALPTTGVFGD